MANGFSFRDEIEEFIAHVQEALQPKETAITDAPLKAETPTAGPEYRSSAAYSPRSPRVSNPQSGNQAPQSAQSYQTPQSRANTQRPNQPTYTQRPRSLSDFTAQSLAQAQGQGANSPYQRAIHAADAQRPRSLSAYTASSLAQAQGRGRGSPYQRASQAAKALTPGSLSAYTAPSLAQAQSGGTAHRQTGPAWTAARDAVTRSTKSRSDVPSRKSGPYINMNASNATKRTLMEKELGELQRESSRVANARERVELMRRQGNVAHQLSMLDAAERNAPRAYAAATPAPGAASAIERANGIPEINALGAGDYGSTARQEQAMKDRYNRNKELEQNGIADWLDGTGHINGQAREGLASLSFGPSIDESSHLPFVKDGLEKFREKNNYHEFGTVAHAGCEAIAVYNTLHDMGKDTSLSQIIYDTERYGYMVADGWLGTNIYKVDDMLRQYGVESATASPGTVQAAADKGQLKDGQIYVASIWNDTKGESGRGKLLSGIHTFEIVYSPSTNADEPWIVYNRGSKEEGLPYNSIEAILTDSGQKGKYKSMLEITGALG